MSLNQLPPEILAIICEEISRNDLRNLRLTCQGLKSAPTRILFRTIYLKFNLRAFEGLTSVAQHPIFSRHVETIAYNGCSIGDCAAFEGFDEWIRCNAGNGFGLGEEERDVFLQRFTRDELEGFYCSYIIYVMGQREIMETEKARLVDAMTRLPNVRKICAYASQPQGNSLQQIIHGWRRLSSFTAQKILEEPDNIWGYNLRPQQFWNLLSAANLSHLSPQLRTLHGTSLDWGRWNAEAMVTSTSTMNNLSHLQELTLGFDFEYVLTPKKGELYGWLLHLLEIQKLDLRFSIVVPLQTHLSSEHFWRNLRELSLSGFRARRDFLQKILLRHKTSLSMLHLSNMELQDGVFNWPRNESWMNSASSWLRFFRFLRARMNLQSAEMGAASPRTDFVQIQRFFRGKQENMSSTKIRGCAIEHFVTGQGSDPFKDLDLEPDDTWEEIP